MATRTAAFERYLDALQASDWTRAHRLLRRSLDVHERDDAGWTPLMWTVLHAAPMSLIDALISAGSDLNASVIGVGTALHIAADRGRIEQVGALLDAGSEVDAHVPGGPTPLVVALSRGHEPVAATLVDRHAQLCPPPGDAKPIQVAATRCSPSLVATLLAAVPDEVSRAREATDALTSAARRGDSAITRLLLEAGATPDGGNILRESTRIPASSGCSIRKQSSMRNGLRFGP